MPIYDRAQVGRAAKEYGFVRDTFEKVLRLTEILRFINADDFLNSHLVLKGGTAINLTIFDLPRLSVDIDFDYTPNHPLEIMLEERQKITGQLRVYLESEGYTISPASRHSHSLDSLYCRYQNLGGNRDIIKIEINYSLRAHIFNPVHREILHPVFNNGAGFRTLDPMEIFAAKGNALLTRAAARDLYDWCRMSEAKMFLGNEDLFRKCFIFYASISAETINTDFDTTAIDDLTFQKIRRDLFPVLRQKSRFELEEKKKTAKEAISRLIQPTDSEREYLARFAAKKYKPDLLFEDAAILERIKDHPMALWKCRG